MTEESPDDPHVSGQSAQLSEDQEHTVRRNNETLHNFPLTVYPYNDSTYLEELATFVVKEEADFKRALHAHLLSNGDPQGWKMDLLKAAVKSSMGFKDTKEVDQFVKKHYGYINFEQFVKAAIDIAIVDENGRVFPVLDETTKPLYDDAVASMRNKDDKERKKDETISRNLLDPQSVEEFHRGVNRLRKAIIEAVKIHGTKDNAITQIRVMDGTGDIVDGINYNHVLTEYERLFQRKLSNDECKKICGRSTLMKGLTKGEAPNCFTQTIVMEVKSEGPEKGTYIGVKKNSREYSEAEIQVEADKSRERRSQADHRMKKWNDRDNRPHVPMEKAGEKEKAERQRHMREQMEGQTASQSVPPPLPLPPPLPSRCPNTTNSSDVLDEITRGINAPGENEIPFDERINRTNKAIPREEESQEESGKDSEDSNQGYSDDENIEEKRKRTAAKNKKREKEKQKKRQEEGLFCDMVSPSSQPPPTNYNRDEMIEIKETAPQHTPSLPLRSSIDHQDKAELENEMNMIKASNQSAPTRRGIGQSNTWDIPEPSTSLPPPVDPPSLPSLPSLPSHQQPAPPQEDGVPPAPIFAPQPIPDEAYHHQQRQEEGPPMQPQYDQRQIQRPSVPCSPLEGQSVSQSPSPIGDTIPQVPMQDQYGQPVYPPHPQYPHYTGQPGSYLPPPPPPPPPPPHHLPPSTPSYGFYPPYPSPHLQEGGPYSPYYNAVPPHPSHPPPPPHFYPSPAGVYPPQHPYPPYPPYGAPPPQSMQSGYGQNGQPGGYGYGVGGSQPTVVNVHVIHGAPPPPPPPPPPSDQFTSPTSNYPTPSQYQQGYGTRDGGVSCGPSPPPPSHGSSHYTGVHPPDPRYATPFSHHHANGYAPRDEMGEYSGGRGRDALEEAARERQTRYERRPIHPSPSPSPHYSPRREERRERSPPSTQRMKKSEKDCRGFGDETSGVNERAWRRRDGGMRRDDERGFGQWEEDHNGRADGRNGPSMDDGRERERERERGRRMEEPLQRVATRQELGRREGEERGDAPRGWRGNGRRDDERRAEGLGQPRGSSTPLNISREKEEEFSRRRSHFNKIFNKYKFDSASRRIRWQVVSILRNIRDKNLEKLTHGQELQFELLEIETLLRLIELGCGNEMELYEATDKLNMSGDNHIFNLLKDMQNHGLCQVYKGKAKNRKTGELEDKVYVMDPKYRPPSSFNLTRFGGR